MCSLDNDRRQTTNNKETVEGIMALKKQENQVRRDTNKKEEQEGNNESIR